MVARHWHYSPACRPSLKHHPSTIHLQTDQISPESPQKSPESKLHRGFSKWRPRPRTRRWTSQRRWAPPWSTVGRSHPRMRATPTSVISAMHPTHSSPAATTPPRYSTRGRLVEHQRMHWCRVIFGCCIWDVEFLNFRDLRTCKASEQETLFPKIMYLYMQQE